MAKKLFGIHHEILRMHMLGVDEKAIAEKLGVTSVTVAHTINSEIGQLRLHELQKQVDASALSVAEKIQEYSKEAVGFLGDIVIGKVEASTPHRAKACMDMLDRAGHGKVVRSVNMDLHGKLTADEIESIKREALGHKDVVQIEAEEVG